MAGFQIATGYVEVNVKYDRRRLMKQADEAGRFAGERFNKSFTKRTSGLFKNLVDSRTKRDLRKSFAELGDDVSKSFNKSLEKSLGKSLGKKRRLQITADLDSKDFERRLKRLDRKRVLRVRLELDDSELKRLLIRNRELHVKVKVDDSELKRFLKKNRSFTVTPKLDTKNLEKEAGAAGDRAGRSFGSRFTSTLRRGSSGASRGFARALGRGLDKNLGPALRGAQRRFEHFSAGLAARGVVASRRFSDSFIRGLTRLNSAFDGFNRRIGNFAASLKHYGDRSGGSFVEGLRNRLDKEAPGAFNGIHDQANRQRERSRSSGFSIGSLLMGGAGDGVDKGGPGFAKKFHRWMARSIELTKYGVVAIAAVVAAATPAIGAGIAGALTIGFAGGLGVLGVLAWKESEKVKSAFSEMRSFIVEDFKRVSAPMEQVLVNLAGDIERTYRKLSPALEQFYKDAAPGFKRFQKDILDGFGEWGPAIEASGTAFSKLSEFMGPMFKEKLGELGAAFERMFAAVERNPEAVTAIFAGIMNGIIWVIDTITWLTEVWGDWYDKWNSDWEGIRTVMTHVWNIIKIAFEGIVLIVADVFLAIWDLIKGIILSVRGIFTGDPFHMLQVFKGIGDAIGRLFMGVVTLVTGIVAIIAEIFGVNATSWIGIVRDAITGAWEWLMNFFRNIPESLTAIWLKLAAGVRSVFGGILNFFVTIGTSIWNAIVGVWESIYNTLVGNSIIPDMVNAILSWFRNFFTWVAGIFNSVKNFFITVWNAIKGVFTTAVGAVVNVAKALFSGWLNWLTGVFNTIKFFFTAVWNTIKRVWSAAIGAILALARGDFDGFQKFARVIFTALKNFFSMIWNAIKARFLASVRSIVNGAKTLFNGFVNWLKKLFQGIRNFFASVWSGVRTVWNSAIRGAVKLARSLFNGFVTWVKKLFSGIRNFFRTVWNGVRSVFRTVISSIVNFAKGRWNSFRNTVTKVFNGIRNFFRTVWNSIRNTFRTVVSGIVSWVTNRFTAFRKNVTRIFNAVRNFFRSVWNSIRNAVRNIVGNMVSWVRKTFSSWIKWIQDKFRALQRNIRRIWSAFRTSITNVVRRTVNWVKSTFTSWVGWIYKKFNALKKNATNIWNSLKNSIQGIVRSVVNWVKRTFSSWVGWIYDKFNALKRNASNIWDTLRDNIERIVKQVVRWVKRTFTSWVSWIYDKFNALKKNATNIWDKFRDAIERIVKQVVKWVKKTFSNWVGWIYDKFNALKTNAGNIWNSLKDSIVDKVTDLKNKAMGVINDFKDGIIDAFDKTKKGVEEVWNKVKGAASAPVKFMIETVYNEGIRVLWSKIADKVPGLGYLKAAPVPKGFARGGVLPGQSTWRQGDDQMVPMRKGEGVAISEAMEIPALRNQLLTWNHVGVKKGKGALRRMAEPTPMGYPGFATGGVNGYSGRKRKGIFEENTPHTKPGVSQPQLPKGYSIGGIISGAGNFLGSMLGGIVEWAKKPFTDTFDLLKGKDAGGSDKKNWAGVPYHAGQAIWDGIKSIFQGKDDEHNATLTEGGGSNWTGATGGLKNAVKFAKSQHGKKYQWGGNGNPSWDCSGYLSAIESVIRGERPHRRWSTHAFGSRGPSGWERNLDSPFMVGITHKGVGHTAGTLMGNKVESAGGGKGVRFNKGALGHDAGIFNAKYGLHNAIKMAKSDGGGSGGGSGNTVMTSFWDPTTASGKKMNAGTISSSVIPMGSKLNVKVGGKSANGTVEDLGPAGFVYKRHHPKALLDLSEPMMQKLTGRRSNTVNGSFSVTKRGTGRTLFGYTNWNGKYSPSKGTNGFAQGGLVKPGSAPMGQGSHDVGGILPDGHVAYNRSGEAEMVLTRREMAQLRDALNNSGDTYVFHDGAIQVGAEKFSDLDDVLKFFRDFKRRGKANGARPQTRVNY